MSKYSFDTTGDEVVQNIGKNIAGKSVLVTGASHGGLGAKTATTIAVAKPAHLILLARSASKVQPVIDEINKVSPETKATFVSISLDDLDSVRQAASEVLEALGGKNAKLDVLINNAGIMAVPYAKTKSGVESQFGTNHLGHFVLTNKLMPALKAAGKDARVVNLTSSGHRIGPFVPDDYNFGDGANYDRWSGYARSKTANILFTKGLAQRGVHSLAIHPGTIYETSLGNHLDLTDFSEIDAISKRNTGHGFEVDPPKSIEQGVATSIRAAFDPLLAEQNGSFMEDCEVADVPDYAKDPVTVEKLWKISEDLAGEKFEI